MSIFGFLRSQETAKEMPEVHEEINEEKEEQQNMNQEHFESLIAKLLEFESCMNSPIDGSPVGVIRTEDVINTIAEFEKVDLQKTTYSYFSK
jgi:hypothetical protein